MTENMMYETWINNLSSSQSCSSIRSQAKTAALVVTDQIAWKYQASVKMNRGKSFSSLDSNYSCFPYDTVYFYSY